MADASAEDATILELEALLRASRAKRAALAALLEVVVAQLGDPERPPTSE